MTALASVPPEFHQLGWQLWVLVVSFIVMGGVAFSAVWIAVGVRSDWEDGIIFWMGSVVVFLLIGCAPLGHLIVTGPDYMRDYKVAGKVLSVSQVLDDASGDLTRVPVVTLDTVDRPLVVNDPRIVNLQGADVVLKCTIEWHYRETDTYACKIMEYVK